MDTVAIKIIKDYLIEQYNYLNPDDFKVYITWKCKTLQNWKYLMTTSFNDSKYYELTYNGDKKEWYLDCYLKVDKKIVKTI